MSAKPVPAKYPEKCRVRGCHHVAEKAWEPGMGKHGMTVPVCEHHYRSRLWWYRGMIWCLTEEEGTA